MRKVITAVSSSSYGKNKKCQDYTLIQMTVANSGAISIRASIYDSQLLEYQTSALLSKLPFVKQADDLTGIQRRFTITKECLKNADEIVCGIYKRDIGLLNKLYRDFRGTSINPDQVVIPMAQDVRELFYDVPHNGSNRVTYRELVNYYDVDIDDARDIACAIFDEPYWEDLPESAIKAAIYLLARLSELGYASATVADAVITHMENYRMYDVAIPVFLVRRDELGYDEERPENVIRVV